jgi:hypothetical protein
MYGTVKIKIISKGKVENFYCNICEYPLVSKDDFISNSNYNCCSRCFVHFAEGRKKEWKHGWRPNKKVVDSYIKNINSMYKNLGDKL